MPPIKINRSTCMPVGVHGKTNWNFEQFDQRDYEYYADFFP